MVVGALVAGAAFPTGLIFLISRGSGWTTLADTYRSRAIARGRW